MASESPVGAMKRKILIFLMVLALHAAVLWTVQSGLMRHKVERSLQPEIVLKLIAPPAPPTPVAPPPVTHQSAQSEAPTQPKAPAARKTAAPPARAPIKSTPLLAGPVDIAAPAPLTGKMTGAAAAQAAIAGEAPPTPVRVELPSSNAEYLQNIKPSYPVLSRRLGEQGKVVLRVFIGAEGRAQKAEIKQSSGFDRLDQTALRTVLDWRYVPGKHAGVPQAMWFDVPISFVLEQ